MELSRYTANAVRALSEAQTAAMRFGHSFVGSEHLLMGIISCGDRVSALLTSSGVTAEAAGPYIDTVVGSGRNIFTDSFGNTQTVKRILELSLYEAKSRGAQLVDTNHILISILRERESIGARIVLSLCSDTEKLRQSLELKDELFECGADNESVTSIDSARLPERFGSSSTPTLDNFTTDLTELARKGRLDPVIGRDAETSLVLQTLCRRTKNNPVLIGEPGVGKSAIAEGVALKLVEGAVPRALSGARLLSLDLASMIAGTKYRGEFEERLRSAVDELSENPGVILFIDELHTIVGAGAGEGSMDAANILKPALARGDLRLIGATTVTEYHERIEKDAALERRFTPIFVCEPSQDEAKDILFGLAKRYEAHHEVKIQPEAVDAAVELSVRFMADRRLPDKAIDLMDEACARVRILNNESRPSVTRADIAAVISNRTGMDIGLICGTKRFEGLYERLSDEVFGQEKALMLVSTVLARSAAGLSDADRPFASFVFVGPRGTGKHSLAAALSKESFADKLLMIDGAELEDERSALRLLGDPSGFTDAEKCGVITEFLRINQFSVVCLTSIDRASDKALEIVAGLMRNGIAVDGRGRSVSLRNCALILTADTSPVRRSVGFGSPECDSLDSEIARAIPASLTTFADAVVVFDRLSDDALLRIADRLLQSLSLRAAKKRIDLRFTSRVTPSVVEASCGEAQEIERLVSVCVENALSAALLSGSINFGDAAEIDYRDGKFTAERIA